MTLANPTAAVLYRLEIAAETEKMDVTEVLHKLTGGKPVPDEKLYNALSAYSHRPEEEEEEKPIWQVYNYADGRMLVEWLETHCGLRVGTAAQEGNVRTILGSDSDRRRVYAAKHEGAFLHVNTVQRWLHHLGRHPSELPEEVWRRSRFRGGHLNPEEKAAVIAAYERGDSLESICQRWPVSRDTLKRWGARRVEPQFNGPKLGAWLWEKVQGSGAYTREYKRIVDWRRAKRLSPRYKTVKDTLDRLGLSESDIPEDCYER